MADLTSRLEELLAFQGGRLFHMSNKYMVHNVSPYDLSFDVTNPSTGKSFHLVVEPGKDLNLADYAGSVEACRECMDIYRYKRMGHVQIYER